MKPKISVIVPAFNVEKYIESCLFSLEIQTLENIEVIIVDDGSTDNTKNIISRFCLKDSRFIYIEQKRQGAGAARNTGVLRSSGEYILFVDSDDWISKITCETLYNKAIEKNLDVLLYEYCYVIGIRKLYRNSYLNLDVVSGVDFIKRALKENALTLSPCNKLIKKSIASQIKFRQGYIHEDIEFNYLLFLKALRVSSVNNCLYFYRRFRPGSNTNEFRFKNVIDLFDIYKFVEEEYSLYSTPGSIIHNADYKLVKFEKLNMESLFKLIDDSSRLDEDNLFIEFLKKNEEFKALFKFYMKNGKSIKHKLVAKCFFTNAKLYISLGRAFYPTLKFLKIAA